MIEMMAFTGILAAGLAVAFVFGLIFFVLKLVLWAVFLPFRLLLKLLWIPFGLVTGAVGLAAGAALLPILLVVGGVVALVGLLAAIIAGLMWVWHSGRRAVMAVLVSRYRPIHEFLAELKETGVPRVPGTAVFMTRSKKGVPPVMSWHVKHNRALHERVVVVHVSIEPVPFVNPEHRLHVETEDDNFWRAMVYYGFMERPDIPPILELVKERGYDINLDDVTYYIGRETVVAREDGKGLPRWQENIFSIMERNAAQVTDFFRLPLDKVVEIGRQVAI
jgi:KUP system potassium uptake protein